MNTKSEDSLYIDGSAMMDNNVHPEAFAIAIDVLHVLWWPTKQPFDLHLNDVLKILNKNFPDRGYNKKTINKHIKEVESFFITLPDGKRLPNPTYFSQKK